MNWIFQYEILMVPQGGIEPPAYSLPMVCKSKVLAIKLKSGVVFGVKKFSGADTENRTWIWQLPIVWQEKNV